MKTNYLKSFLSILFLITIFSCSNEVNTLETDSYDLKFSLIAPNKEVLSSSVIELKETLASGKENVVIKDIQYLNIFSRKNSLVAKIEYSVEGKTNFVMVVRNIENIIFEKGTILKFENQTQKSEQMRLGNGDIYISCSGGSCCYPSGTYNPNTGEMTTSCKCEGGNNSQCVMRISETPPNN
jgi:hypothetical protein